MKTPLVHILWFLLFLPLLLPPKRDHHPLVPGEAGSGAAGGVRPDGQRLAVLHQGPRQAGYHRFHWDGRDDEGRPLANGVYLYRLVTGEGVLTRKQTLLR